MSIGVSDSEPEDEASTLLGGRALRDEDNGVFSSRARRLGDRGMLDFLMPYGGGESMFDAFPASRDRRGDGRSLSGLEA